MTKAVSERRLRGALVGYGFIGGQGHVPAYAKRNDVDLVAVADICAGRRALVSERLPQARLYDSAEALFAKESELDFIDIATPPCDHAAIAHLALDRGLHVLCEKPFTTTLADAAALLEHAESAKRVIFPCHNYKHAPVVTAITDIIESGRIGEVRSITLETFRNTHAKGVLEWNTHWRRHDRWSGGGIAMDHGSHTFYLAFHWLKSLPTAVLAKMVNQEPAKWDTEDNFFAVLTFPGGRLVNAHLTWTAGVRKVIYTVQGDRGAITVDDDDLQLATMRTTDGPDVAQGAVAWDFEKKSLKSDWMDASHTHWFNAMFDKFQGCIASGDFVGRDAQEAYHCVDVITTAYRSARDGCRELPLSGVWQRQDRERRPTSAPASRREASRLP